jgi:hypothetical protein
MRRQRTVLVQQDRGADIRRELVEVIEGKLGGQSGIRHLSGQNSGVPLSKISWLVTVAACVIAAILLLVNGYLGYFGVLLAVGAAAAVNLR